MKKLIVLICVFGLIINTSYAQTPESSAKAKKILDEISAKTKKYTSLFANFVLTIENKDKKINEKQEGSIWVKEKKYKLQITNQTIMCDGQTVWTYLKDANEVQINNVSQKEDENKLSPNNIFTLYEKGFKFEFVKEEKKGAVISQIINLYPLEPKQKAFHTIQLTIDKVKKQITKVKVNGKDGNITTYTIKKFTTNENMPDATFTFNKTNFPGVEVVDLRE